MIDVSPDMAAGEASRCLAVAVGNAPARKIIGRHFDTHAVTDQNADAMLAHFAGNCRQHDVSTVIELDFEKCVGLFVDDRALRWY